MLVIFLENFVVDFLFKVVRFAYLCRTDLESRIVN